jgi:hypothetical protein
MPPEKRYTIKTYTQCDDTPQEMPHVEMLCAGYSYNKHDLRLEAERSEQGWYENEAVDD